MLNTGGHAPTYRERKPQSWTSAYHSDYLKTFATMGTQQLAIALCTWSFIIRDQATARGVPDAKIRVFYDFLGSHYEWAVYTGSTGKASLVTYQYVESSVSVEHPLYQTREELFDSRVDSLTVDLQFVPSGMPTDKIQIVLYAQYDMKKYFIRGSVTADSEKYIFSGVPGVGVWAPGKAVLWLYPNTSYTLTVEGDTTEEFGISTPFGPYILPFTTGVFSGTYWVDVLTGDVKAGLPPNPSPQWWEQLIQWMTEYPLETAAVATGVGLTVVGTVIYRRKKR